MNTRICKNCGKTFQVSDKSSKTKNCSRKCGYAFLSNSMTKWSKLKIIETIQEIHNQGISLSSDEIKKTKHKTLPGLSRKYFGSWVGAVKAAGLESFRERWSKQSILEKIKEIYNKNISVNYFSVKKIDNKLAGAVSRHFSSWEEMIQEAGLPSCRKTSWTKENPLWSKEKIIRIIKSLHRMKYPLHRSRIRNKFSKLFCAAKRSFGSWKNAIKSSGLPLEIDIYKSPRPKFEKTTIIRWIKKMNERKISLNSWYIQRYHEKLFGIAKRIFGSWDDVLKAAQLDLSDIKQSYFWTPAHVIKEILQRHHSGHSLFGSDMEKEDSSLKLMAKKFFGSWRKGVEAAGLKYKHKTPELLGEKILQAILLDFFPNKHFEKHHRELKWLKGSKKRQLELDFYCEELKLGVEFQGPTHSLPVFGQQELDSQIIRDRHKRELCEKNSVNLIAIDYKELFPIVFSRKLSKLGILHVFNDNQVKECSKYFSMYKKS